MQTASYIPKSLDAVNSVAQIPETAREQADRSAVAYRFWLACGVGTEDPIHVKGRSRPFT